MTRILIVVTLALSAMAGLFTAICLHPYHPQTQQTSALYQNTADPAHTRPKRTFHYPSQFVAQLKNNPHAGQKIFHEFCQSCHAAHPLIPVHAPRIGIASDWAALRQQPITTLLLVTKNGVGPMPARGGCFECSDAQLQETIAYILQHTPVPKQTT